MRSVFCKWIVLCALAPLALLSSVAQDAPADADVSSATAASDSPALHPKRMTDYDLPGLSTLVNLKSLDPWDVVQLIEFLAYKGGLNNIVIGPGVSGLTTKLKFDQVTVGEALEIVLSVNRLAYEVRNGIITVMTDAEYTTVHGGSFYDQKEAHLVTLTYADPGRIAALLGHIKSDLGTIVHDSAAGSLLIIDTPEKVRAMQMVIAEADTPSRVLPTQTQTFRLQHAEVEDMQKEVTALLSKEAGSVRVDRRTKTLIVSDLPPQLERISELVAIFDRPPKGVFIEAKIVEVRLSDDMRLGINWNHLFEGVDPRFSLRSVSEPVAIANLGDSRAAVGRLEYNTIVAGGDLSVVLDALQTVGETKILSNPQVAVLDGEEASIKVVTDQPYAEAQLESGSTNVVGETVKFIEVGVSLSVVPRINDDEMISMSIKPEVSSKVGDYQAFRTVPIIRKSTAETSVMIKNSETVIIAGMIVNEKSTVESQVPLLGSIPLLGMLFKSKSDVVNKNELIVFLTPRLMAKGGRPSGPAQDGLKRSKPARPVTKEGLAAMTDAGLRRPMPRTIRR